MYQVDLKQAQKRLPEFVEEARTGLEILIGLEGRPCCRRLPKTPGSQALICWRASTTTSKPLGGCIKANLGKLHLEGVPMRRKAGGSGYEDGYAAWTRKTMIAQIPRSRFSADSDAR